jgi:hypothetical protein
MAVGVRIELTSHFNSSSMALKTTRDTSRDALPPPVYRTGGADGTPPVVKDRF